MSVIKLKSKMPAVKSSAPVILYDEDALCYAFTRIQSVIYEYNGKIKKPPVYSGERDAVSAYVDNQEGFALLEGNLPSTKSLLAKLLRKRDKTISSLLDTEDAFPGVQFVFTKAEVHKIYRDWLLLVSGKGNVYSASGEPIALRFEVDGLPARAHISKKLALIRQNANVKPTPEELSFVKDPDAFYRDRAIPHEKALEKLLIEVLKSAFAYLDSVNLLQNAFRPQSDEHSNSPTYEASLRTALSLYIFILLEDGTGKRNEDPWEAVQKYPFQRGKNLSDLDKHAIRKLPDMREAMHNKSGHRLGIESTQYYNYVKKMCGILVLLCEEVYQVQKHNLICDFSPITKKHFNDWFYSGHGAYKIVRHSYIKIADPDNKLNISEAWNQDTPKRLHGVASPKVVGKGETAPNNPKTKNRQSFHQYTCDCGRDFYRRTDQANLVLSCGACPTAKLPKAYPLAAMRKKAQATLSEKKKQRRDISCNIPNLAALLNWAGLPPSADHDLHRLPDGRTKPGYRVHALQWLHRDLHRGHGATKTALRFRLQGHRGELSTRELANLLGLTPRHTHRLAMSGKLAAACEKKGLTLLLPQDQDPPHDQEG